MKYFIRIFSYLFHPIFMPIAGVASYFILSPRFFNPEFRFSKLLATIIMTVIIPILSYFMLKNLGLVKEIHLKDVKDRKYPLVLQALFTLILIQIVFDGYEIPELYFYFVGILASSIGALLLVLFKFKASLHMIGIAGFIVFILGISLHFGQNQMLLISLLILACGATASSRLEAKAHTIPELIIGFFVGAIPQLLVYNYWL